MNSHKVYALTFHESQFKFMAEDLIDEVPIEIIINQSQRILIMHTPYMSKELVHGFLYTEGYVSDLNDITDLSLTARSDTTGGLIIEADVTLKEDHRKESAHSSPQRISYSSCGICGREELEEMRRRVKRIKSRQRFSLEVLKKIPETMRDLQPLYQKTRAAHAALLYDPQGRYVTGSEDVGRHNALDKVIGKCFLEGIPTHDKVVVSSGRASLEMILKAVRGGFPVFVAMSRPTFRAVEAAKFYNLTLIDLARETNRVYCHARRLEEYQR